jgi:hypothetical protein
MLEKAVVYDKNGLLEAEINKALEYLREFRTKYPFAENPQIIETLKPNDIFKYNPNQVGPFFHYLEYYLKPLGHLTIYGSHVYENIRNQIEDFKELLHVVVEKKKSLAQKIDAPWDTIKGLGGDEHIAKKIIFCFNYESNKVLPIFKTSDLRYFVIKVVNRPSHEQYYSHGAEYEYLTSELLKTKDEHASTKKWEITHFARFLYNNYPPPRDENPREFTRENKIKNEITNEQLELQEVMRLLGELQKQGLMSGLEVRDNRTLWTQQPQEREALIQKFKELLRK